MDMECLRLELIMEMLRYTLAYKFHHYGLQVWEVKKEKCPGQFFIHGCHVNAEIHMHTKFHCHALYGLQVWEVKK